MAGYGFIDFRNHETAKFVLETLNGKPIGKTDESESNNQTSLFVIFNRTLFESV